MRRALTLAFTLMLGGPIAAAQMARMPRDRPNAPPPPQTGTGAIRGRVVDAQTGTAVARARVRLNWMGPAVPRQPVTTDDSGAFEFTGLPSGLFMLMADKSTFLAARYPEAGQTLRTNGRPLALADGQVLDHLVVPMYHGSAITGRVVDAHGDPVESAQVHAFLLPKSGRGKPQPRSGGASNDLGEYRLPRLEPGRYLLLAMARRFDMFVPPPGRPDGPEVLEPQPAPTFYPGVLAIDQAQAIVVERGATVTADIPLVEGMMARVTGTLVDASGQPVTRNASVMIRPMMKEIALNGFGTSGAMVKPDGTFQATLPLGEYEIEASARIGADGPPAPGQEEFGSVRVSVAADVSGVSIQLGLGATVSGRISFDGTAPVPPPPGTTGPGRVAFVSTEGLACRSGSFEVAPDWTFTVKGVIGSCTAQLGGGLGRWFVKSITQDGNDLMDQPVTFTAGQQMRGVEVVMTDKRAELTFHVTDEQGTPTRDYVGLLFPADRSKWMDRTGRYVRTVVPPPDTPPNPSRGTAPGAGEATPALAGGAVQRFAVPGVNLNPARREVVAGLPGDYFAIALDDLDLESLRDPEVLAQLARGATRVTMADDGPAEVNLRRITLARPR